jgi:hypothetical protein
VFPAINLGALERYRVPVNWKGEVSDVDPRDREAIPFPRPETEAATGAHIAEIDRLQEILYAQAKYGRLDLPELKPMFNAFRDVPVATTVTFHPNMIGRRGC